VLTPVSFCFIATIPPNGSSARASIPGARRNVNHRFTRTVERAQLLCLP